MIGDIGRKQGSANARWCELWERCTELVSKEHLDRLTDQTLQSMERVMAGQRCGLAWSGGKDSAVVEWLARKVGIVGGTTSLAHSDLNYPAMERWTLTNIAPDISIHRGSRDLAWLQEHPRYLFPATSKIVRAWFAANQWKAQHDYFKAANLGLIVLGRRTLENSVPEQLRTDRHGITRYSPIREWGHAEVLAFIRHHDLQLPPCYGWPNGWIRGPHPWNTRHDGDTHREIWSTIAGIDPTILQRAASFFPEAGAVLAERAA